MLSCVTVRSSSASYSGPALDRAAPAGGQLGVWCPALDLLSHFQRHLAPEGDDWGRIVDSAIATALRLRNFYETALQYIGKAMTKKPADARKKQSTSRREVLGLDDFTEADLALIMASHAPEWTKAFDHEMDDDITKIETKS
jgi:hypothetical protein